MAEGKQGLVLDKVVLLGRTLDEYRRYFDLNLDGLRGSSILDLASGVSSFCAEAHQAGLQVTACDPIYERTPEDLQPQCEQDLDHILNAVTGLKTYCWDFYESPEKLRRFRERAWRAFLDDYRTHRRARYAPGRLPTLPFRDQQFDLTLVSYLLFVYEDQLDYEFHRQSLLEILRVTRGEVRIYPVVSFEAVRCGYIDRLAADPAFQQVRFEEVRTEFEFLRNSNYFLRLTHRSA